MLSPAIDRPCSFRLQPLDESLMCGRSDIFIHGCACCTHGDIDQPPVAGCSTGYSYILIFSGIVINEYSRRKLRVGDTIIVEHYTDKGDIPVVEEWNIHI